MHRATIVSPIPEPIHEPGWKAVDLPELTEHGNDVRALAELEITPDVAESTKRLLDACEEVDGKAESIRAEVQ